MTGPHFRRASVATATPASQPVATTIPTRCVSPGDAPPMIRNAAAVTAAAASETRPARTRLERRSVLPVTAIPAMSRTVATVVAPQCDDLRRAGDGEASTEPAPSSAVRAVESGEGDHDEAGTRSRDRDRRCARERPYEHGGRKHRRGGGHDRARSEPGVLGSMRGERADVVAPMRVGRVDGRRDEHRSPEQGQADQHERRRDSGARPRSAAALTPIRRQTRVRGRALDYAMRRYVISSRRPLRAERTIASDTSAAR